MPSRRGRNSSEVTVNQFAAFVKATGYQTAAERARGARTWRAPGYKVSGSQPVAGKLPNAWGLYDAEGNIWEWTLSEPDKGVPLCNRRGGSWIDCKDIDGGPGHKPSPLVGLSRYYKVPVSLDHRYDDIGFRCGREEQ